MNELEIKKLYNKLISEKLKEKEDILRMKEYYTSFASFYPKVLSDPSIINLFNNNNINIANFSLDNMLNSNNVKLNSEIMNNGEIRCRIVNDDTKSSYVIVDTKEKKGGSPHQNSHEHYFTIEICRIEQGYAIVAELLKNKKVKLVRYDQGQYWASMPGIIHNTSLYDGSHTTTLKTASPIPDWYGTGNVINSEFSYFTDSRTKTMDLDQMNYVINHYDGIVGDKVVSEFKLEQKWNDLIAKTIVNPYEVLITFDNREDFRQLLLITRDNNLAAFYAHLANKNIKAAVQLATTFGNDSEAALDFATENSIYDVSVASDFIKKRNIKH